MTGARIARQMDGHPYSQPREQNVLIFHLVTEINGRSGNAIDAYSEEDAIKHAAKLIAIVNQTLLPGEPELAHGRALVEEAMRRKPAPAKRREGKATITCQVRIGAGSMAVESL